MTDNMESIRAAKQQLRKQVQASLKDVSENEVAKQSLIVHQRLFSSPEYQSARNVSVFLSMPRGEISTGPIVKDALLRGKKVFVPFIYKDKSSPPRSLMDMVALQSDSEFVSLKHDKWGIPSLDALSVATRARCLRENFQEVIPVGCKPDKEPPLEHLDLVVVPCVAFDLDKRRLGHGKGYYDTFFTEYYQRTQSSDTITRKMPYLVGIALKEQVLPPGEEIPTDKSDWTIDAVISGDQSST